MTPLICWRWKFGTSREWGLREQGEGWGRVCMHTSDVCEEYVVYPCNEYITLTESNEKVLSESRYALVIDDFCSLVSANKHHYEWSRRGR